MKKEEYFYDLVKEAYPDEAEEVIQPVAELMFRAYSYGYAEKHVGRKHNLSSRVLHILVKYVLMVLFMLAVSLITKLVAHAPDWAAVLTGTVWVFLVFNDIHPDRKDDLQEAADEK